MIFSFSSNSQIKLINLRNLIYGKPKQLIFRYIVQFNMCQNNLENWSSIPTRNLFKKVNCNTSDQNYAQTYQHYQRHLTKIAADEIDSYCLLLQGRINNKNLYVCNVISFQLLPQKPYQNFNSKQMSEVIVWTDKMIPLLDSDWTKENIIKILVGFKRLVMIYGPFHISPQQICKNQNEEIKVWISQIPQKCKADTPALSQKDMLKSLASLLQKRNSQLAFKINAARTMRQAVDSINSIFLYNSPEKHYKTFDFADFRPNKNLFSACNATFHPNRSLKYPFKGTAFLKQAQSAQNSLHQTQYHQSTKNVNKQTFLFPNYNSTFNSTTMSRPQSKVYNPFFQQMPLRTEECLGKNNFYEVPNETQKYLFIPSKTNQPSRNNSRHLTFTPVNKFGVSPRGEPFSHRLGSQRVPEKETQPNGQINNFDITIINNNVSNFINNFSQKKSSKGSKSTLYKNPTFFKSKKAKSQGKVSKNTSFWLNYSKVPKKQSNGIENLMQKKKPLSSYQEYNLDSIQRAQTQFIRNTQESLKTDNCETHSNHSSGRKDNKLYTFCTSKNGKSPYPQKNKEVKSPKQGNIITNKGNFMKKMNPSNSYKSSYNRSNTTQFFPSKKEKAHNNKTIDMWASEPREKRFNSFAVDIQHEQPLTRNIPTTKSVGIDENSSTSSKKLQLKKQLKMEFGNLFDIVETSQSPRCSYSQKLNSGPLAASQSKTDLMKESILKQKIKQKNEAFAELKKQALKVLTDL